MDMPSIIDVRGRGLMIGVELGPADGGTGKPRKGLASVSSGRCEDGAQGWLAGIRSKGLRHGNSQSGLAAHRCAARPRLPQAITKACARRGMLLMTAGARESLRFLPPLTVSKEEADIALGIFREALKEVVDRPVD